METSTKEEVIKILKVYTAASPMHGRHLLAGLRTCLIFYERETDYMPKFRADAFYVVLRLKDPFNVIKSFI